MKIFPGKVSLGYVATLILALTFTHVSARSQTAGVRADLRSSATVLTTPIPGGVLPTAPAGGVVVADQTWVCDAAVGFAPVVDTQVGVVDSFLAIWNAGQY